MTFVLRRALPFAAQAERSTSPCLDRSANFPNARVLARPESPLAQTSAAGFVLAAAFSSGLRSTAPRSIFCAATIPGRPRRRTVPNRSSFRLLLGVAFVMPTSLEASMSKRLEKRCKELRVLTVEAQEAIWQLAPRDWIGKRKAAIAGVARALGWTFARTWNIAHGRARRIDAHEMDSLRDMLGRVETLKEQRGANNERLNELIFARHEIARSGRADSEGRPGEADLRATPGASREAGGGTRSRSAATPAARG